ncbi:MAG: TonB-dependent receptor [Acidobacteria bacterium]|nr:TonB-dependent receptor [Acidobacteriota bacterium]
MKIEPHPPLISVKQESRLKCQGCVRSRNRGAPGQLTQNLTDIHPYPVDLFRVDYATVRIDHEVSSKNHFFARMNNRWTPYVLITNWPRLAWTRERYAWHQVYGDTHIFSPTLVHTFQFGWYLNRVTDGNEVDGYKPIHGDQIVRELGIQGVNPRGLSAMGFPQMNITGYPALSVNPGGRAQNDHDRIYTSSWTWSRGKHVAKFGGELRNYINFNGSVPTGVYGAFTFNGNYTGYGYADFLLGIPFTSQRLDPITERFQRSNELGIYFDDAWKASQRLTLNLGLRWDRFGATRFDDGLMFNWDSQTGDIVIPAAARGRISPLYPVNQVRLRDGEAVPSPDSRNFAPRLGAAYRLSDKMVLRGGYGIYNEFLGQFRFNNSGGPFQLAETFQNVISSGVPLLQFPRAFPGSGAGTVPSQNAAGYPLDVRNGYLQQFSLTIERQFRDIGLRATYVGTRGTGMNYTLNINKPRPSETAFAQARRPFPQFINATTAERDGRLKYDGLTLRAHRVTGPFTFDVHWTWAQSLSDYLNLENPYSHQFWNRTGDVPSHRVVASSSWQIPVGRGKAVGSNLPRSVSAVTGGWRVGYVAIFATGLWFSPAFAGSDPSGTNTAGGLPDRIADGNLPSSKQTVRRWFDTAAFVTPPRGRFGNSGMNILAGPGRHVHNLSLEKDVPLTDRIRFEFMAAGTNVFNRPHFTFPGNNVSVPTGGVITSSYSISGLDRASARRIELRGRIKW